MQSFLESAPEMTIIAGHFETVLDVVMKNSLLFVLLMLFAAPSLAATGTTYIGMIIVVVFVTVMLILYYMVVYGSDKGDKDKKEQDSDPKH